MRKGIALFCVFLSTVVIQAKDLQVPRDYPTIAEAIAAASAGDTVLVANGTYTQSKPLKIDKPLTVASLFINSRRESDIQQTIIQAAASDMEEWVELAAEGSKIVGFTFVGSDEHTLNITSPSGSVSYCRFIGGKDQLSISAGGGYVGHCYFENAGDDAIDCDNSISWTIEYNTIVNAHQDGIEVRLHPKDVPLTRHVFRHNTVIGSGESGIQLIDYQGNSFREFHIHHNVFQDCRGSGVSCMYREKDDTREAYRGSLMEERAFIYNNTFVRCNYGLTLSPGLVVLNNLFTNLGTKGIERGVYLNDDNDRSVVDYCLFYRNPQHFDQDIRMGSQIRLDLNPLLDENHELKDQSPCIDAGIAQFRSGGIVLEIPAAEYAGRAPDLGAKEYRAPR